MEPDAGGAIGACAEESAEQRLEEGALVLVEGGVRGCRAALHIDIGLTLLINNGLLIFILLHLSYIMYHALVVLLVLHRRHQDACGASPSLIEN